MKWSARNRRCFIQVVARKPFFSSVRYSYVLYGIFCLSFLCKNILCLFVCYGISERILASKIGCPNFFFSCFVVSNLYRNNRNKHTHFETNLKSIFVDFTPTGVLGLGVAPSYCRQARQSAA